MMNLVLDYTGFVDNVFMICEVMGGVQYLFQFPNNYGASIIKHVGSYGCLDDLWELAVIQYEPNGEWHLNYETPITDDVIGYLTDSEVRGLLRRIQAL